MYVATVIYSSHFTESTALSQQYLDSPCSLFIQSDRHHVLATEIRVFQLGYIESYFITRWMNKSPQITDVPYWVFAILYSYLPECMNLYYTRVSILAIWGGFWLDLAECNGGTIRWRVFEESRDCDLVWLTLLLSSSGFHFRTAVSFTLQLPSRWSTLNRSVEI